MKKINDIYVSVKPGLPDARGAGIASDIKDLAMDGVEQTLTIDRYQISGPYAKNELNRIGEDLLADPVTQVFGVNALPFEPPAKCWAVSVSKHPGVSDPAGSSAVKAIRDLGMKEPESVRVGRTYLLIGSLTKENAAWIAKKLLYNPIIEDADLSRPAAG